MKKQSFWQLAALALAIVLMACSNPSGPGDQEFSVSGKFTNGSKTSYFTAQENTGGRAAAAQVPLIGTLDDGDITFRLKGFYDEESGAFTLSATSSYFKYSINGNSSTGATASIATRNDPNDPFGTPTFVQVDTEVTGTEVADGITRGEETAVIPGLDQEDLWGVWYEEAYPDVKYIVNDWGMASSFKEGGTWSEGVNFGFTKITDNGSDFDVIADYTAIAWAPPRDPSAFPAYLAEQGYKVIPQSAYQNLPLVTNGYPVFGYDVSVDNSGFIEIESEKNGSTYGVFVAYDPDDTMYQPGGTPETPYELQMTQNGSHLFPEHSYGYGPPDAFATFEEAIAGAQDMIERTGGTVDLMATIQEELGVGYSTAGIELNWEIHDYYNDPTTAMPQGDDPDIAEKQHEWSIVFENWVAERLKHYFPGTYSPESNLLIEYGVRYNDIQMEWASNPFDEEPVTKYIKWNVSLVDGKLTAKAYRSGEPDSTTYPHYLDDPVYYSEDFAGTSGLTILSEQSDQDSLDNNCIITMVR